MEALNIDTEPTTPPPTRGGVLKLGSEGVDVVLVDVIRLHRGSPPATLTAQDVAGGEPLPVAGHQALVRQVPDLQEVCGGGAVLGPL